MSSQGRAGTLADSLKQHVYGGSRCDRSGIVAHRVLEWHAATGQAASVLGDHINTRRPVKGRGA